MVSCRVLRYFQSSHRQDVCKIFWRSYLFLFLIFQGRSCRGFSRQLFFCSQQDNNPLRRGNQQQCKLFFWVRCLILCKTLQKSDREPFSFQAELFIVFNIFFNNIKEFIENMFISSYNSLSVNIIITTLKV